MVKVYYSDKRYLEKQCVELPYETIVELTTAFQLISKDEAFKDLELITINLS